MIFQASRFRANHKDVHTSQDETRAMDEIKDIANSIHFTNGKAFAFAEGYLYFLWEANKVRYYKFKLFCDICN